VVDAISVGRWDAYFLVQAKYHHTLRNPLAAVQDAVLTLSRHSPFRIESAPALQTLLVTAVLASVLAVVALRRRDAERVDLLLALWAVGTWILPHAQANVSTYRSQAALLPLALLVRRLPAPLVLAIVVAAAALCVPMAELFLQGRLV
jgi:hypothetical protein